MLKAVQHGTYYKNSRQILTYKVTGPAAELEEYKLIESMRQNKTPDQLANDNGFPLMFLALDQVLRSGDTPRPSYNLVKNFKGDGYNRDTMKEDMARYTRIAAKTEDEMAAIQAKRALGIDVGDRVRTTTFTAPQTQAQPAVNTTADDIAGAIAAGAELAEENEVVEAGADAGTETLGQ